MLFDLQCFIAVGQSVLLLVIADTLGIRNVILLSSPLVIYYSKICLIHHHKGIRKSDELSEVTNYANR